MEDKKLENIHKNNKILRENVDNNYLNSKEENILIGLEKNLGYKFKNIKLLEEAITHTSYANENGVNSNEKLEFLGDSILEFVSSEYMYNNYPKLNEGELTKARATVVCEDSLYEVAKKHEISKYIRVGRSEMAHGGNLKLTILADSVEAIIAAMYFDSNIETVKKFIIDNLKDSVEDATRKVGFNDYKTVLQEKLQVHGDVNIEYNIVDEDGPDHDKTFTAEVSLNGKVLAKGIGKSKKMAEMQAAKKALGE